MKQSQRRALASLGVSAGVIAIYRTWRHFKTAPRSQVVAMRKPVGESQEPGTHGDAGMKVPPRFHARAEWVSQIAILLVSIIFSVPFLQRFTGQFHYLYDSIPNARILSRVSIIIAMALSALIYIRRNSNKILRVIAVVLLFIQLFFLGWNTINAVDDTNPISLLETTALGMCGVGIALAILAFRLRNWRFSDPFAIGVLAISLGLLCVPGLIASTSPLKYPDVNGAALLFATGPKNQKIRLDVVANPKVPSTIEPTYKPPTRETFTVRNLGNQNVRWVLLVIGDARLGVSGAAGFHGSPGLAYHTISVNSMSLPLPASYPGEFPLCRSKMGFWF
jgi:hypothetical protein